MRANITLYHPWGVSGKGEFSLSCSLFCKGRLHLEKTWKNHTELRYSGPGSSWMNSSYSRKRAPIPEAHKYLVVSSRPFIGRRKIGKVRKTSNFLMKVWEWVTVARGGWGSHKAALTHCTLMLGNRTQRTQSFRVWLPRKNARAETKHTLTLDSVGEKRLSTTYEAQVQGLLRPVVENQQLHCCSRREPWPG